MQTELPIDLLSLTRLRKRRGEEGVEVLLSVTIDATKAAGLIRQSSLDNVIVDTIMMPKAVAHPTDTRMLEQGREHLVRYSNEHGSEVRQNYDREAPRLAMQIGRYAHAKQYKRMKKAIKTLNTRVVLVHREIELKVAQ